MKAAVATLRWWLWLALSQWRDRAAARLKLETAVSEVSEAVLRQIAANGGAAQ